MNNLIALRYGNRLYNTLLFLAGITFMLIWLPLLRCLFDGSSYTWGQSYFGLQLQSAGLQADYGFLILSLLFYAALFFSFYWLKNRKLFFGLLLLWFIHSFGNFLFILIVEGDVMFHGDTLGVHISLLSIILPLSALALILIGLAVRKDLRSMDVQVPWGKINRRRALILLAPLPIQAVFFATGEPHNITDQIAVIIAIIQALTIWWIFVPEKADAALPD